MKIQEQYLHGQALALTGKRRWTFFFVRRVYLYKSIGQNFELEQMDKPHFVSLPQ